MNEHVEITDDLRSRLAEYNGKWISVETMCEVFPEIQYYKIGMLDSLGREVDELKAFRVGLEGIYQRYLAIRNGSENLMDVFSMIFSVDGRSGAILVVPETTPVIFEGFD